MVVEEGRNSWQDFLPFFHNQLLYFTVGKISCPFSQPALIFYSWQDLLPFFHNQLLYFIVGKISCPFFTTNSYILSFVYEAHHDQGDGERMVSSPGMLKHFLRRNLICYNEHKKAVPTPNSGLFSKKPKLVSTYRPI